MCAITGILSSRHVLGDDLSSLTRMTHALAHRGPDGIDYWSNAQHGVAFGHCRLAVIDLSPRAAQPMSSSDGRFIITFNGEIYNHHHLKKRLDARENIDWKSASDTEVLIEAIRVWGLNATLDKVNGMFAFCLYDQKLRTATFARDRFGEKPCYLARPNQHTLIFGSELRAIEQHPAFSPQTNRRALADFLSVGYIGAPACIYQNVFKLPAASTLTVKPANLPQLPRDLGMFARLTRYWSAPSQYQLAIKNRLSQRQRQPYQSRSDGEALQSCLTDAVSMRMQADVPVGVFLSGGIDSSLVSALAQSQSAAAVKTFTIGIADDSLAHYAESANEARHAARVAASLGTDHHELYLSAKDAAAVVAELPAIYDEPFADPSQIPTAVLARFAKDSVKVSLAGDGADEAFAGYSRHVWMHESWPRLRRLPASLRRASGAALAAVSEHRWDRLYGRCEGLIGSARKVSGPGEKIHKLAGILRLSDNDVRTVYQFLLAGSAQPLLSPVEPTSMHDPTNDSCARLDAATADVEHFMLWDLTEYLSHGLLTKVDRASMHSGLEVRLPYLDNHVIQQAMETAPGSKIWNHRGKQPLRRLLRQHVPDALVNRPKTGFSIPLDQWLRGEMNDWAEQLLAVDTLRRDPLLDSRAIRRLWQGHKAGAANNTSALWRVLMYLAWRESRAG